jgi:tRNA pseudouridine55 synthase
MDFAAGEILLVDKPLGWTSFDVVNKMRYEIKRKLKVKKIKVGHAGTLDPLADGLLILCTGKKTKEIENYMGMPKMYSGTITLGATTPSYDLETQIDATFPLTDLTEEMIYAEAKKMEGDVLQNPPIFSAKKIDGNKAYDLARAGKEVILQAKLVQIQEFKIISIEMPLVHFEIICSKGTYIRSIAHDFGKNLGNGGHLSSLHREAIGDFKLTDAKTVDQWISEINLLDIDNIQVI